MASRYWVGGAGTWDNTDTTHWSASSGGAGGQSAPGASDDVVFDSLSGGGTVALGADVNVKSITMGAFTGTLNFGTTNPTVQTFSNSGTGVRTLTMGSGTWTISGNNATIFDQGTTTNLTFSATTATVILSYSATGTRTFQIGTAVYGGTLQIPSGTDAVKLLMSTGGSYGTIDFSGFKGSLGGGGGTGISLTGDLTLGTGMTSDDVDSTHPFVFGGTGTQTITSNGVTLNHGITVQGTANTVVLADSLVIGQSHTTNVNTGTFNANNKNFTCGAFVSTGTGTRTVTMGSGTWTLTGFNTTVFSVNTTTGLTFNANTAPLIFNYTGSTGTRTIRTTTGVAVNDIYVTGGTDIIAFGTIYARNLDMTGFSGTETDTGTVDLSGGMTLSATQTYSSTASIINFSSTSTGNTIKTNGVAINRPLTFNGVGGGWTLGGSLDMSGATPRALTLTAGTLNVNNFNVNCGSISSSGATARTLDMGYGTWTLTGTGTIINFGTSTNFALTSSNCTINITDISASSKTLSLGTITGGISYGTINITAGGAGAVIFTPSATMTIGTLSCAGTKTLTFAATRQFTVTNWYVSGTKGNILTIASSSAGSAFTLSVASGVVRSRYVSLQDSTATGGATFYAINSTNVSGNTGWTFAFSRVPASNRASGIFRQNLLKYSEVPDNAAWTTTSATWTQNSIANPIDGAVTAYKMTEANATAAHRFYSGIAYISVAVGQTLTASVYVKAGTRNWVVLTQNDAIFAYFNLTTGLNGTVTSGVLTSTALANGWYRLQWTFQATTAAPNISFGLTSADNTAAGVGDGTGTMYFWGTQLVRSNWAGPYVSTTSSAVDTGNIRNIVPQNQNLFIYSQELNTSCSAVGGSITIDTTDTLDPWGTNTAEILVEDGSIGTHRIQNLGGTVSGIGNIQTLSIFVKAGERTVVYVQNSVTESITVDLTTGTILSFVGGIARGADDARNGWYRIWITYSSLSTSASLYVYAYNGGFSYQGVNNTKALYIAGGQYTNGTNKGPYTRTTSAVINTGNLRNSTQTLQNLIKSSRDITHASWTNDGTLTSATVSGTDHFGATATFSRMTATGGGLQYIRGASYNPASLAGTYTLSAWVKTVAGGTQKISMTPSAVTAYSADITVTGTWSQVSYTVTIPANASTIIIRGDAANEAYDIYIDDIQLVRTNWVGPRVTTTGTAYDAGDLRNLLP